MEKKNLKKALLVLFSFYSTIYSNYQNETVLSSNLRIMTLSFVEMNDRL